MEVQFFKSPSAQYQSMRISSSVYYLIELLRYLCIPVIIDKNYRQMINILHSTACVIALYKIIEAALLFEGDAYHVTFHSSHGGLYNYVTTNFFA